MKEATPLWLHASKSLRQRICWLAVFFFGGFSFSVFLFLRQFMAWIPRATLGPSEAGDAVTTPKLAQPGFQSTPQPRKAAARRNNATASLVAWCVLRGLLTNRWQNVFCKKKPAVHVTSTKCHLLLFFFVAKLYELRLKPILTLATPNESRQVYGGMMAPHWPS